jgi:alpha-glucosidase
MRPLFYDFDNGDGLELDRVDDQFLIGPAILQAPIVHQGQQTRLVTLPGQGRWMDANTGQFLAGGRTIHVTSSADSTPIYLREGSLVPMQVGVRTDAANDLADIELHVILGADCDTVATLDYVADDGLSYGYQRGARSVYRLQARREGAALLLDVEVLQGGWKPLRLRVVGYDGVTTLQLRTGGQTVSMPLSPMTWHFSGGALAAMTSVSIDL